MHEKERERSIMDFNDVIGQEQVKQQLLMMVEENRLPHALLFCGPTGCGKMAMAMAFAAYLLTEKAPEAHRHNTQAMLAKWQHPDLHFSYPTIRPQNASSDHKVISDDYAKEWCSMIANNYYFTLEEWLEKMKAANQQAIINVAESENIIRKLALKSSQGGYKICIIWLPERMNGECANKMLKIIEEPPSQTLFIMVSEEPEKLLETIRSRTQRIDFKQIDTEALQQALVARRGLELADAHRIARVANGSWLKAIETLDASNENNFFFDMFVMLMRLAYQRKVKDLKKWTETVAAMGREKQKRMLTYFIHLLRENFMYNFGKPELVYMTEKEENFAKNFARFINEANIVEMTELYSKAIRDIGQNANGKIVFFDLTLKTIVLLIKK